MAKSPVALLFGSDGTNYIELALRPGIAIPGNNPGLLMLGSDGTNGRYIKVSSTGVVAVDGSAVTQPISVSSPIGQTIMASSISVAIASNQSSIPINDNSGSVTVDTTQLPAALVGGRLDASVGAINNVTPLMGNGVTGTGSLRVTIASDNTAFSVNSIQFGSWAVTANAGTNLNTSALALDATVAAQSLVDNAPFTDGTTRVVPAGFIFDETAGVALTENDGGAARIDGKRAQILVIEDATTRGTRAAVKAGSTAPTATDPALVVVLSPNQPTISVSPSGSNATTGIIFGRVLNGSSGALTAVRQTTYTEQTTNFTGSVKSTSANDTNAGTGAHTIKITYFDSSGVGPHTETVTLNGTTAVNLVNTDHCYIEKIEVVTVGSTGSNAGTISLFTGAAGTGTTVGSIAFATNVAGVGDNQTLWAHHYVPAGKTASLYNLGGGTTGNQIAIQLLKAFSPLVANDGEDQISDFITISNGGIYSTRTLANAIKVVGFARVTAYIISNGSNTNYFASFDYSEQ